jgi:pimeloyl-ACP methyl ester carboxylesterase
MSAADSALGRKGDTPIWRRPRLWPIDAGAAFHTSSFGLRREPRFKARRQPVKEAQPLLDRPGNNDIQLDLFLDYGTNVPLYPKFQAFFRERKPPTLIVWGKNDKIFPADGATPYLRDLPDAELHLLDTGHFALEDKADVMIPMIRDFLYRKLVSR